MAKLYDIADIMRSKNAGPFLVTVDIMFFDKDRYETVIRSQKINQVEVAKRYHLSPNDVDIIHYDAAWTIKVTMKRKTGASGGPQDRDVYGAQQHGPLMDLEISGL